MPGIKRKLSRSTAREPSAKLAKQRTGASLELSKETSIIRGPLPVPKWPSLRRVPTLVIPEEESDESTSKETTASLIVGEVIAVPSLPKVASVVEGDDVVTTLKRLASGSSIGRTTSFSMAPPAICKELSKSSTSTKVPLIAKSISRGGSIIHLDGSSLSLDKIPSLVKSLSKPSLTKEESVKLIDAASAESKDDDEAARADKDDEEATGVIDVPLPPGGLMEVVFSFDTTGSMYSYLDEVRNQIQLMVQQLKADIAGIRIAIFAHGDYCDKSNYIVQWIDFGSTTPEICKFVKEVKRTGGGDFPEAYELVLKRCQSVLSWTPGSKRSLIMIGDATPHDADYDGNDENIDWQTECDLLREMGVRIYGVHAGSTGAETTRFYQTMAKKTHGRYLKLQDIGSIFDIIMAICYREGGDDLLFAYESEVRGRSTVLGTDMETVFDTLKGTAPVLSPLASVKGGAKRVKKHITTAVKTRKTPTKTKPKTKTKAKKVKTKTKTKIVLKSKKIRRELVTDTTDYKFKTTIFGKNSVNLSWTMWKKGLTFIRPRRDSTVKTRGLHKNGFVKTRPFGRKTDEPAIYEFGVRSILSHSPRVFAMYMKTTLGFKESIRWDRHFLTNHLVQLEIDYILPRNGDILVRKGVMKDTSDKTFQETCSYIKSTFDYAWNNPKTVANSKSHRRITRGRIYMSGAKHTFEPKTSTGSKTKPDKLVKRKVKTTAKKLKAANKKVNNKKTKKNEITKKNKKTTGTSKKTKLDNKRGKSRKTAKASPKKKAKPVTAKNSKVLRTALKKKTPTVKRRTRK